MDMKITGLSQVGSSYSVNNAPKVQGENAVSFSDVLKNALVSVSNDEKKVKEMNQLFVKGELENLHDLTIAAQKADISFQTLMEVKNKLIDAYREITRIQV